MLNFILIPPGQGVLSQWWTKFNSGVTMFESTKERKLFSLSTEGDRATVEQVGEAARNADPMSVKVICLGSKELNDEGKREYSTVRLTRDMVAFVTSRQDRERLRYLRPYISKTYEHNREIPLSSVLTALEPSYVEGPIAIIRGQQFVQKGMMMLSYNNHEGRVFVPTNSSLGMVRTEMILAAKEHAADINVGDLIVPREANCQARFAEHPSAFIDAVIAELGKYSLN